MRAMSEPKLKVCRKCHQEQPISDYYPNKNYKDDYMNCCKSCLRIGAREHYKKHAEKINERKSRHGRQRTKKRRVWREFYRLHHDPSDPFY